MIDLFFQDESIRNHGKILLLAEYTAPIFGALLKNRIPNNFMNYSRIQLMVRSSVGSCGDLLANNLFDSLIHGIVLFLSTLCVDILF